MLLSEIWHIHLKSLVSNIIACDVQRDSNFVLKFVLRLGVHSNLFIIIIILCDKNVEM